MEIHFILLFFPSNDLFHLVCTSVLHHCWSILAEVTILSSHLNHVDATISPALPCCFSVIWECKTHFSTYQAEAEALLNHVSHSIAYSGTWCSCSFVVILYPTHKLLGESWYIQKYGMYTYICILLVTRIKRIIYSH